MVTVSELLELALQRSGYAQEGLSPSESSTRVARQLLGALLPQYNIDVQSTADEAVLSGVAGGTTPQSAMIPIVNLLAQEICLHYGLAPDPMVSNSCRRDRALVYSMTPAVAQINRHVGNNLWGRAHAGFYWYREPDAPAKPKLAEP